VSHFLGIDAGTTVVKAALFDEERGALAGASVDCAGTYGDEKVAEIDMEQYWKACKECITAIAKSVGLAEVKAVCVSSQGVTFVPVDRVGRELRKGIIYYDVRAEREAKDIIGRFGEERIYSVTGQPVVSAMFEAAKLLWIRRHEPEVLRQTHKVLLVHDYLVFRLSGQFSCVQPLISSSLLFDLKEKKWWEEMLDFVGLSDRQLPGVYRPGDPVGAVTKRVSRETGLPEKALLVSGAIDQVCGMLGVGNICSGLLSESTGSVLAVHTVADGMFANRNAGIHNFCNTVDATYALISVCPTAGSVLNWFKETFCEREAEKSEREGVDVFDLLMHQAGKIAAGSDGLVLLPHFVGRGSPDPSPYAKGVFYGLGLHHSRGHFVRAIIESIAYMLRSNLDVFRSNGFSIQEIRSFGGGSRSGLWNQIKADVCGVPVVASSYGEPGCLGAAILAGVGCGAYRDIQEGCGALVGPGKPCPPGQQLKQVYEDAYGRYLKLNTAVEPMFEKD
jgi:xylulokinase